MLLAEPLRMRGIHVGLLLNFYVPIFYSVPPAHPDLLVQPANPHGGKSILSHREAWMAPPCRFPPIQTLAE